MNVNTEEELRELFLQEECKHDLGSRADNDLQKLLRRKGIVMADLQAKKAEAKRDFAAATGNSTPKS
jgi:flagellar biosynthesis/type III secretory pathway chaperone